MAEGLTSEEPDRRLATAVIDSGGLMSQIVNHMANAAGATGDVRTDTGPLAVLHELLAGTFSHDHQRPPEDQIIAAAGVLEWASEAIAREIILVDDQMLEELAHGQTASCAAPPRQGRRKRRRRPR